MRKTLKIAKKMFKIFCPVFRPVVAKRNRKEQKRAGNKKHRKIAIF